MKRYLLVLTILLTAILGFTLKGWDSGFVTTVFAEDTTKLRPKPEHARQTILITQLLDQIHYRKTELNDSLSSVVWGEFLTTLDPNKLYFLQSDIDSFEKYRYQLDDDLEEGKLEPAFEIFERFQDRFESRMDHVSMLLSAEFDFTRDEYYETDREKVDWAATDQELNEYWRKMIKYQLLNQMLLDHEKGEAIAMLNKRFTNYDKIISQYKSEDVYQLYINALSESYDPHTNYFSPKASEDFKINMSLSLEGIGARLSQDGDYTKVVSVIGGGPAFKSEMIHADDRIIAVAQGSDGEWVDVVGWRTDEVVQLIRGPKGTVVRLKILKAEDGINSIPVVVSIVRDKIKLEEQSAQSKIVPVFKDNKQFKLGVITIPSFYIDFEEARKGNNNYKSTTRDVKKLLQEFSQQKVDGVLIDLRRNGGGSLQEAIELTGLFIKDGPVVQVKNSLGKIDLGEDEDPEVVWDGPLTVLINRYSASASEIFAGAIQDYERGIVIGEQTYGKGTVQNLIPLHRYIPDEDAGNLGELKITIAKYYRITGNSTQHKGVIPDISLPSSYEPELFGESSMPSALPWDEIRSARYKKTNMVNDRIIVQLNESYHSRLLSDPKLKELQMDVLNAKNERNHTLVSLNEEKRRQEIEAEEARKDKEKLATQMINTETGEFSFGDIKMKDTYLKQGMIILAELITSVG